VGEREEREKSPLGTRKEREKRHPRSFVIHLETSRLGGVRKKRKFLLIKE